MLAFGLFFTLLQSHFSSSPYLQRNLLSCTRTAASGSIPAITRRRLAASSRPHSTDLGVVVPPRPRKKQSPKSQASWSGTATPTRHREAQSQPSGRFSTDNDGLHPKDISFVYTLVRLKWRLSAQSFRGTHCPSSIVSPMLRSVIILQEKKMYSTAIKSSKGSSSSSPGHAICLR